MKKELTTKQIQDISINILKQISDLCEELNLRYYLIYGTLIGAVRHNGFIPWDDDLDIMIPRPDYDILLNHLNNNKPDNLTVFNYENNKDYPYMITRISDDRTYIEVENEKPIGMGVFIDIYPYDGLGNTINEALSYGLLGDRLSSFCYQASRKKYMIKTTNSLLRKVLKLPIFCISKIIGKDFFQNMLNIKSGKYNYDESEYVGCFIWLSGGIKDIFKRQWFDDYEMCQFDKYQFRIPKDYDDILRQTYGDYMILPDEKDRIGHHCYKAYLK